jgi:hypothetical protein
MDKTKKFGASLSLHKSSLFACHPGHLLSMPTATKDVHPHKMLLVPKQQHEKYQDPMDG